MSFFGSEIQKINDLMTVSRLLLFRLFVYKQRVLNNPGSDPHQLKIHICGHMPFDILRFACRLIDDVAIMESEHKTVKLAYKLGSRRIDGLASEMFDRIQMKKIITRATDIVSSGDVPIGPTRKSFSETHFQASYTTGEGAVAFTASYFSTDWEEMEFNDLSMQIECRLHDQHPRYLSTFISLEELTHHIAHEQDLLPFYERFKAKDSSTILRLHRFFKYDATEQGIPECTIYADRSVTQRRVGATKNEQRFDWVNILKQYGQKVCSCKMQLYYTKKVFVILIFILILSRCYKSRFKFVGLSRLPLTVSLLFGSLEQRVNKLIGLMKLIVPFLL